MENNTGYVAVLGVAEKVGLSAQVSCNHRAPNSARVTFWRVALEEQSTLACNKGLTQLRSTVIVSEFHKGTCMPAPEVRSKCAMVCNA